MMKSIFYSVAVGLISCVPAFSADAVFSADGKTVTLAPYNKNGFLEEVDVASGAVKFIPLPPELKDASVESLARGAEDELFFLASETLWYLKGNEPARKVAPITAAENADDLFIDVRAGSPTKDWIFITAEDAAQDHRQGYQFFARKPGTKKFERVYCRRINNTYAGTFALDGRLFFAGDRDLWEGGISLEDSTDDLAGTLVAGRIAPLGFFNTDGGNSGGMGVRQIHPVGKWLYVHLGGRHMDSIVRLPIPEKPLYSPTQDDTPSLKENFSAMGSALSKTEILIDDLADISGFCVGEANGKPLVFYRGDRADDDKGHQLFLWDGTGAPRVIGKEPWTTE